MQNDFYDSILILASHPTKAAQSLPHGLTNTDRWPDQIEECRTSDALYMVRPREISRKRYPSASLFQVVFAAHSWRPLTGHYYTLHITEPLIHRWRPLSLSVANDWGDIIIKRSVQRLARERSDDGMKLSIRCLTFNAAFIYVNSMRATPMVKVFAQQLFSNCLWQLANKSISC